MDIVWIILDSLSYDSTPFCQAGPNTMPEMSDLAESRGTIFKRAYSPGPTSPSSHGSFFTGKLPSETGMHELSPYFDFSGPHIAEELSRTHTTHLISSNQFLFNGLENAFNQANRLGIWEPKFETGTNPATFESNSSRLIRYGEFLWEERTPIRSAINGVEYKSQNHWGPAGNFADEITRYIYDKTINVNNNTFIIANYMDVHPPLTASNQAVREVTSGWSRGELPIGVGGGEILEKIHETYNYSGEDMYALYKSAIWDLDQVITPLIRDLIATDTLVMITADHGHSFRRKNEFENRRIHVPLIIFSPNHRGSIRNDTVNIRSLPKTTLSEIDSAGQEKFNGSNILRNSNDQVSVTEFIYDSEIGVKPIPPTDNINKKRHSDISYRVVGIKGDTRIDYDGECHVKNSSKRNNDSGVIKTKLETVRQDGFKMSSIQPSYDDATKEHLRELGYL